MNSKIQSLFFLFAMALFVVSCGGNVEGEQVEAQDAVETNEEAAATAMAYSVDTESSVINWEGAKLIGSDNHLGVMSIQNGELLVEGEELVGGTFTLDMTSIECTDLEAGSGKEKLEGHLMSGDFFEVEKFPTATFEIAEVNAVEGNPDATHEITGNLTMKDITKSITIPATVEIAGDKVSATTPQFVIDRTQWNVMFQAGALGTAKDKIDPLLRN